MSKDQGTYSAASLTVLKGLEAVRMRPGMYIGGSDSRGLTHCVYEIFDNAVDEALAGHCTEIHLTLGADGSVEVIDNGRGIPVDIHPTEGVPGVIVALTSLHAGGKFDTDTISGGLHGVGASVVNALSTRLDVTVRKGGKRHEISFQTGEAGQYLEDGTFKPGTDLRVTPAKQEPTGSTVKFWPDRTIFEDAEVDRDAVVARARQTAFLVPGLRIIVRDETQPEPASHEFQFSGGMRDFVEFRAADRPLSDTLSFTGKGEFIRKGKAKPVEVEIALRWGVGYDTDVVSFVNIVQTPKGGKHIEGFEASLLKVVNEQLKAQRIAKAKDQPVTKDDILEGVTAVVTVRLAEPEFVGQTKDALGDAGARGIVASIVADGLRDYFTGKATKGEGQKVLKKVQDAARTRLAAREIKEAKRRKTALESASMPAKLVDCRSEDVEQAELFIVEGDSALGTFKKGRDSEFQAALPIRGKILNTLRASEKQMLANAECAAIIQVLGAGSGRSFNMENLRYGKLIALADADVDGAHIRCLLLTLCWKYLRPLLEAGRVYSAVPPLYRIEVTGPKKESIYCYSDQERDAELARLDKAGARYKLPLQRYKGLGEMDDFQLRETTLDPAKRRLRRMTLKDVEAALVAFELCMGPDVAPRKDFIVSEGGLLDEKLIDA